MRVRPAKLKVQLHPQDVDAGKYLPLRQLPIMAYVPHTKSPVQILRRTNLAPPVRNVRKSKVHPIRWQVFLTF